MQTDNHKIVNSKYFAALFVHQYLEITNLRKFIRLLLTYGSLRLLLSYLTNLNKNSCNSF